jgi:hypothetical protein
MGRALGQTKERGHSSRTLVPQMQPFIKLCTPQLLLEETLVSETHPWVCEKYCTEEHTLACIAEHT